AGHQAALGRVEPALARLEVAFPMRGGVAGNTHGVDSWFRWGNAQPTPSPVAAALRLDPRRRLREACRPVDVEPASCRTRPSRSATWPSQATQAPARTS